MSNLCCKINPAKTCKTCSGRFCTDHVHTPDDRFSVKVSPSQCHACYHKTVRLPELAKTRPGMTAKDLLVKVRELLPVGYVNITINIQEGQPGFNPPNIKWQIYHENHTSSEGETPELAFASFEAKVKKDLDPTKSTMDKVNV